MTGNFVLPGYEARKIEPLHGEHPLTSQLESPSGKNIGSEWAIAIILPTTEFFCDSEAIACLDSVLHRLLEGWSNP
ncbi:hypothetical protein J0895_23190 [Phormidium pseudopriestleyi FRX01]|uniref:Uncharacterized protein n=1 Tax=Phormidium pseudopriestleyi FRX01 TaxID=1759528 RepID=A0ABS3FXR6_9CYAN|nr:hypothetical protein [Phormidium pseudopriestleyi]MBO0351934.1 hypothetical protein [Phormidium pseudopriestleyi FRX01]